MSFWSLRTSSSMQLHPTTAFLRVITVLTFIAAFSESVIPGATALSYTQSETIRGEDFFTAFDFQKDGDPTGGHVIYVGMEEARELKLVEVTPENSFILRAESTQLAPDGRKSVRIKSKRSYTEHVAIYNIFHMPQGCGTWPAVWTVGPLWPTGGEIDIIQGANGRGDNVASLHTSPGCTMPENLAAGSMLGKQLSFQCAPQGNDNTGCGVKFPSPGSFGLSFNEGDGGYYAMERTKDHIKVWFWRRHGSIPLQIQNPGENVDPDTWGTPSAFFPGTSCNISDYFGPHSLIISLNFCGTWAGKTYAEDGCGPSCKEYVGNNPRSFQNAFFNITSITIFSPP